jgi:hypothetical protein
MTATLSMGKCHNAINVRRKRFPRIRFSDKFRGVRGAVTGCNNGDVVPCTNPAIFSLVAQKGRDCTRRGRVGDIACGEIVGEGELFKPDVMYVDMRTRFNGLPCPSHHLAIADNGLACTNASQSHFVPGRDGITNSD